MTSYFPTGFDDVLSTTIGYAKAGIPVFPCVPGEKKPLTKRGFHDATTDLNIIRSWFERYPDANIAIPTGKRSGIVVVDFDPQNSSEQSAALLSELPPTLEVATGGGFKGIHHYFQYPDDEEVRCSAGRLGPGIDIRGEGGYVLVPPSKTQHLYEVIAPRPLATLPTRVLEQLRKPKIVQDGNAYKPVSVDGPDILEGTRNRTLFRIGAKLRGGGSSEDTILATLTEVNSSRCRPPLDSAEVEKIARSASSCKAGTNRTEPDVETLKLVDLLQARRWNYRWTNSQWLIYECVLHFAEKHGSRVFVRHNGQSIPAVSISVSHRTIADKTGLSRETVTRNMKQLRKNERLRTDNADRHPKKAGTLLLPLFPIRHDASKRHHTHLSGGMKLGASTGDEMSPLRRSAPGILRLGPGARRVLEILVLKEGRAKKRDIADMMKRRTSNLTRKDGPLCRLKSAGIVHIGDDGYVSLSSDWQERLEEAHGKGLEEEAAEVQRTKHELEREIYNCGADSTEAREALDEYEEARMLFHEAKTLRAEELD